MRCIGCLLLCAACGGGDPSPDVEILEVAPSAIVTTVDTENDLSLRVRYADATGDLGEGLAEIHDCRVDGLVTTLELPPIANEEAVAREVAIEGELTLLVSDISDVSGAPGCAAFDQPAPAPGQLSLCVVLIDAAGNPSDADCSEPIAVSSE